jgi:hypothetical protein
MYIPTTFFSSQGACIVASTSAITGSGLVTSGSFISASVLYQYYQFEMSDKEDANLTAFTASLNILSGSTGQAKILIVGGGGTGAQTGNVNDGSIRSWEVVTTGGGGAGGVVYYNQFPLSSGSYEIGIGKATSGPGGFGGSTQVISGFLCGKLGQPSWIKLPNNFAYTPFSNSYLVGYGGGGASVQGEFDLVSPRQVFIRNFSGQSSTSSVFLGDLYNGSGGGGGNVVSSTINGGTPGSNGGMLPGPNGGLNGVSQGSSGGTGLGGANINGFCINGTGVGGGGAGAAGVNRQLTAGGEASSGGGIGVVFNLTGTPTYYAGGGGGRATINSAGATGRGLGSYGCGGNGSLYGNNMNGQAGVVIIAWPICLADSDNCREYVIRGGASGGTMTYLPCDSQTLTTTTIDFAYTGSACLYKVAGYPTTTGTVTLTETGSCNTFIPIAPTVTCTTGSKTPVNVYDYSLPGQCYPTPSSCQRLFYPTQTINYVDVTGVSQSVQVGGWFTGTGQVCARTQPTPTITGGTLTNSGLICGFYCSGSI